MSDNRNQHYIPQFILRRFLATTDAGKLIHRFRRGDAAGEARGVRRVGAQDYFYRDNIDPQRPDSLDDYLNQTESKIGPVIAAICDKHFLPLRDSEEYVLLIRFIHDMYLRTPSLRAQLARMGQEVADEIALEQWFVENEDLVRETLQKLEQGTVEQRYLADMFRQKVGMSDELSAETQKVLHAKAAARPRDHIIAHFKRRYWRILVADPSGPTFVIGDEPVVIHSEYGKVRTGLRHPTSRVTFPLSPTIALQGCYSEVYQKVQIVNKRQVRMINGSVGRVAYKEIFSSTPDFEWWHQVGKIYTSTDWMKGIAEATWPRTHD